MEYGVVGEYVARKATISDLDEMYKLLAPYMVDENEHQLMNDMYLRKAKSLLRYYIENEDSIIISKNGSILGFATSSKENVLHLVNNGDVFSAVMLFKVLLCDIQNIQEPSYFKIYTEKQREVYSKIRTPNGYAVSIEGDKGIIYTHSKLEIQKLYNMLKAKYE